MTNLVDDETISNKIDRINKRYSTMTSLYETLPHNKRVIIDNTLLSEAFLYVELEDLRLFIENNGIHKTVHSATETKEIIHDEVKTFLSFTKMYSDVLKILLKELPDKNLNKLNKLIEEFEE